jgi:catechol 2,3-dioxygenase-like lactoylglutathione lyase family enzyme
MTWSESRVFWVVTGNRARVARDTTEQEDTVFPETEAVATIPVKDIDVAKRFYERTLELKPTPDNEPGVMMYENRHSKVLVYQSQYAGTNQATAATFIVGDDIERTIDELKEKGVSFEHYDLPGVTRRGDIHGTGRTRAAWFKDPDGNILALVSG